MKVTRGDSVKFEKDLPTDARNESGLGLLVQQYDGLSVLHMKLKTAKSSS